MKLKLNLLLLVCIGMISATAQTAKKAATKGTKPVVKSSKGAALVKSATSSQNGVFAEFETTQGKILVQLEYKKTPITVANFISLAEGTNTFVTDEKFKGKPFYNGLKFHRVIADFMIQGGDPQGNGSGGPGYAFKDEIVADLKHNRPGVLSMANSGPKTNGSQFFITHKETPWLDGKHTVFGYVVKGQDVVNAVKQDDVINKITITRRGEDAKKFDAAKVFANYMANKGDDDKKEAALEAEKRKNQAEMETRRQAEYKAKYASVIAAKAKTLNEMKMTATETASGLKYNIAQKGTDKKPVDGANVYVHYAGYLEDGTLFDSSYEVVAKEFGKFDERRAQGNGYQPFPFQAGKKEGLIPGFLEGISLMNFGDKAVFFIPSKLGYGEKGAGSIIPPNSNIIFEVELLEAIPTK